MKPTTFLTLPADRRTLGMAFAFFLATFLLSGCGTIVKTGNVGLVVNHFSGKVDGKVRHAGFNPLPPMSGYEMIEIPTHKRTYTMVRTSAEGSRRGDDSVRVNTSSANVLNVDISVTYHLAFDPAREEGLKNLYDKYRSQFQGQGFDAFEENQLRPLFRKFVSNAFGKLTTVEAMTGEGKNRAAKDARDELNRMLNPDSIIVDEVRIRAIWPDENTKNTLRTHLVAEQNLRLSKLNQQLAELVNARAVSRAEAEAKATRIRAASLTPRLVKYKHLDAIRIVGVPQGAIVNAGAPVERVRPTDLPASSPDAENGVP
ncbi:MAG: SPFH domain-containing protein [Capsulimonadales bacterium]|nr:SPFH domain-containing protein [Capsulimonadales bacterium]